MRHIWGKIERNSIPPMGAIQKSVTFGEKIERNSEVPMGEILAFKIEGFRVTFGEKLRGIEIWGKALNSSQFPQM